MKKVKGLIIMLLISLSLFGIPLVTAKMKKH